MSPKRRVETIPTTDFYGEASSWPLADVIHCEQLSLRSALYDWQIRPHRHRDLMQIFYVVDGSGSARLDNTDLQVKRGDVLIVPEQCVHTFLWEKGSSGYVLFIASPLRDKLEKLLGPIPWSRDAGGCYSTAGEKDLVQTLFASLCREYQDSQPQREIFLESLVLSLSIWINRKHLSREDKQANPKSKATERMDKFNNLLRDNFTQYHNVDWYAQRIGITPAHLNSICQQQKQLSALSIIHQRLLVEAQRNLIYTNKSAAEIAELLGFGDPAYFNRFFKRLTGYTPGLFRKRRNLGEN